MKNKNEILLQITERRKSLKNRLDFLEIRMKHTYRIKGLYVKNDVELLKLSHKEYVINGKLFFIDDQYLHTIGTEEENKKIHNRIIELLDAYLLYKASTERTIRSLSKLLDKFHQ